MTFIHQENVVSLHGLHVKTMSSDGTDNSRQWRKQSNRCSDGGGRWVTAGCLSVAVGVYLPRRAYKH